ncbi:seryl-tRNA synthetase [Methylobacterium sp. 4-46]|uniref:Serine--tRNA ligase n=1 Tax=Methylobacterium sp. (strain 4-46) TaxID=426117 RepID=SYS_METS4|nr:MULTISPECIES: serine--tRNA ligase [Methylobacterium]B0UD12.1 RecName: Full=Serine--tRNA ligase; AltName: Full=Seryl-tRNA synthetase; Short=SerRS; AltName: Full=Seryl-tRNA(Ser/Sec) synthetase [Methylobacterium sp. 4-46]ACA20833.1 seryl-tRNA synthetase [Methylobacterium sp. 4-46]WFT79988.1 serine--tRNA ligase [Methylobacterium nodulans]
MHDIRVIRDNPAAFDAGLRRRGLEPLAAELVALDDARKAAISAAQVAQERRNALSKEIGAAKKARDEERARALMAEVARLKEQAPGLDAAADAAARALDARLAAIPNTPGPEVPEGRDEHDNVELRRFEGRGRAESGRQHFELGEAAGLMDFEAAARLSGSRFVVLKGRLARLERALGQFMLDLHTAEHGYTEVAPPLLVRDEAMFGTAQLPKFRDDQFAAQPGAVEPGAPGRWLIPTAEVPLTNLVRESILSEDELPLRFTALTPCFRAEAGAAGRDTRGMLRQHQFTKVELVSITAPEQSAEEHERMLACAEAVLRRLDLPYRVMTLCTGDMGFASQKTYDIEVWLPGQGTYREISSCSVCGDFQARRMEARFRRREDRGLGYVHSLNGSGVAVGRALIAVMENYQNPDGSVTVPSALAPYMGGVTRIEGPHA